MLVFRFLLSLIALSLIRMVKLFIITAHLSALRMKGVSVISSSNVQTALQKISKISIPLVLLFLIFVGVLSNSSLSVDAAQTDAGNTPASGTISDNFVRDAIVVSGTNSPFGGSVIYSVLPDTEYYIRFYVPLSQSPSFYIHFFNSYPSLGSRATFYSNDFSRDGNFVIFHFTTSSSTSFVVLSFRFGSSYTDYKSVNAFIQSASIGSTLGLYSPLFNNSSMRLDSSYNLSILVTCSAVGGIGNYNFTVDIIGDSENVNVLYRHVPAGDYIVKPQDLSNMGDNPTVRITVSDYLDNTSTITFDFHSFDYVNHQLSSPEVDVSDIPLTSFHVESSFLGIIGNFFHVLPSEITILLVPVILFCVVGWWLHR